MINFYRCHKGYQEERGTVLSASKRDEIKEKKSVILTKKNISSDLYQLWRSLLKEISETTSTEFKQLPKPSRYE